MTLARRIPSTRPALRSAADQIKHAQVLRGQRCPECDGTACESNGHAEYRCVACDHRWGWDTVGRGQRGEPYGMGVSHG